MQVLEESIGSGEVFVDVGTDDEIELAEGSEVVGIDVEFLERMMSEAIEDVFVLVGKGDVATFAQELITEDPMSAAEVYGVRGRAKWHSIFF
jgi:hypothetical protein